MELYAPFFGNSGSKAYMHEHLAYVRIRRPSRISFLIFLSYQLQEAIREHVRSSRVSLPALIYNLSSKNDFSQSFTFNEAGPRPHVAAYVQVRQ